MCCNWERWLQYSEHPIFAQHFHPEIPLLTFIYSRASLLSIQAFFLAMAMDPDVQCKAQVEIDTVVGQDWLLDFSDWVKLPYVNAIVEETLWWHSITPLGEGLWFDQLLTLEYCQKLTSTRLKCSKYLGIPHLSTEDDEYNGYFIPKGTLIIGNIW